VGEVEGPAVGPIEGLAVVGDTVGAPVVGDTEGEPEGNSVGLVVGSLLTNGAHNLHATGQARLSSKSCAEKSGLSEERKFSRSQLLQKSCLTPPSSSALCSSGVQRRRLVGLPVGFAVGSLVVGDAEGAPVGSRVVGPCVGDALGLEVGELLSDSQQSFGHRDPDFEAQNEATLSKFEGLHRSKLSLYK
jgi:hypothetical protein